MLFDLGRFQSIESPMSEASSSPTILWFRQDLRLNANPILEAALKAKRPFIPVFIWDLKDTRGAASCWWLHHSLKSLDESLRSIGSRLIFRIGDPLEELQHVLKETKAQSIHWNRLYEPNHIARDKKIKAALQDADVEVHSHNGSLLIEPWNIKNKSGEPYKVFTPFWKELQRSYKPSTPRYRVPSAVTPVKKWPKTKKLKDLGLLPAHPWHKKLGKHWQPGEQMALKALKTFAQDAIGDYKTARDLPAERGTSRLSPHLHFGEISPAQIWDFVQNETFFKRGSSPQGSETFLKEVGWREFSYNLLYHFPKTPKEPLSPKFKNFPWKRSAKNLKAWQQGLTGYPIVDAGMRELWETGWMHNRVRMIVASFLIKDLFIDWRKGADWFWDTLVDADLANNTQGWQWTAGCGADAAPYFRVFNPILQGEKFDVDGAYVKKWVPELAELPAKWVHRPFEAPSEVLDTIKFILDEDYPRPLVDHAEARQRALEIWNDIKSL